MSAFKEYLATCAQTTLLLTASIGGQISFNHEPQVLLELKGLLRGIRFRCNPGSSAVSGFCQKKRPPGSRDVFCYSIYKKKTKNVITAEKCKIIGKRSFFLVAVARLGISVWVLETSLIVTDGYKSKANICAV